jgi:hypothetical protein
MDLNLVREASRRFFRARHPVILLTTPGCGPLATSPSYARSRYLRFQGERKIRIRTEAEFVALVTLVATGKVLPELSAELQKAIQGVVCYCAKVLAILSLRERDCVHEAQYATFRQYLGALQSLAGWEFTLIPAESKPSRRVYRVVRTHSRLLAEGHSDVLPGVTGVMEIRLIRSQFLRLVINGLPSKGSLTAQVELSTARRPLILPEFTREIQPAEFAEYQMLDDYLARAFREPSRATKILQNAAAEFAGNGARSYPMIETITELLEVPRGQAALVGSDLKVRIAQIRARLWDNPVIASHVRNHLDGMLSGFAKRLDSLPLEIQADIADVTMSLKKIENGDGYLDPQVQVA